MALPAIPEERHPVKLRAAVALDNYEPVPRSVVWVLLTRYDSLDPDEFCYRLEDGLLKLRDVERANFLIDNGRTVQAYYAAGWSYDHNHGGDTDDIDGVLLHPFPTEWHPSGAPKMRHDCNEQVESTHGC
jgi:hypothetical protein